MAVYVNGFREVEEILNQLPERVAQRVVVAALRAGAAVIAKQARVNLRANPSLDSGLLERSISSRARRRSRKGKAYGAATVSIGAIRYKPARFVMRKGKHKPVKAVPSRYAHLVEFGTAHMPAEPFLRPALDEKAMEAITKIGEAMGRGIDREAAKLAAGKVSFVTGKKIR